MKLEPDDPRLTAHILGELPPGEAREIERAIAADPALGLAAAEVQAFERLLSSTLAGKSDTLSPRQRGTILTRARTIDSGAPALRPRRRITPWLAPLAAAAAILITIQFLLQRGGSTSTGGLAGGEDGGAERVSMLPAPGPIDASAPRRGGNPAAPPDVAALQVADNHPDLRFRGPVSAAHHPTLQLPIRSGSASHAWVSNAILTRGVLPGPDAVRAEELLNHFTLRPVGASAIHQGLTLTVETLRCPWKPSATLAVVNLRGSRESAHQVAAKWNANPANVWRYRLLGHAIPVDETAARPLPSTLEAASDHTVVLEIEPASNGQREFGSIEWTVDGIAAPELAVTADPDQLPSADSRFAALVCAFTEWLVHRGVTTVDTDMLAALSREVAADDPATERLEFLELIARAILIANSL